MGSATPITSPHVSEYRFPATDVPTEILARERDKFAPLILKLLKDGARYHKGIPLAECEDRDGCLYLRDRCYVP